MVNNKLLNKIKVNIGISKIYNKKYKRNKKEIRIENINLKNNVNK